MGNAHLCLQGCLTAAFTKDKRDTYAGNGVLMGNFGFKLKKNPKKKTAPNVSLKKQGRGWPRKIQPNKNDGPSLTTAQTSLAFSKPPSTDT